MEIKRSARRDIRIYVAALLRQKGLLVWTTVTCFFVASLFSVGILGLYYGTQLGDSSYSSFFSSFYRFFRPSLNVIPHLVRGVIAQPDTLRIDIAHTDFQRLAHSVSNAKTRGYITPEDKSVEVNATVDHLGAKYKINLKLRGTLLDHVKADKWSFRVSVRNDGTLFGMRRFSLSSPETRAHIHEWIYQKHLSFEGLVNLRYQFVDVVLNGKNLGIYALEEFFDKRLLENNNMREGIMVKPFVEERHVYQEEKVHLDPVLKESYDLYVSLLNAFRDGKLEADKLFDIEKSAKYFALSEVYGGQHGHEPINFVCYFNPVTALLEPIGYDSNVARVIARYGGMITSPRSAYFISRSFLPNDMMSKLFDDESFYSAYVSNLAAFTEEDYFNDFSESIEDELQRSLSVLYKEYPYFDYFARDFMAANVRYIRNQLVANGFIKVDFLNHGDWATINLDVDNTRDLSIQAVGLALGEELIYVPEAETTIKPTTLTSKYLLRLVESKTHVTSGSRLSLDDLQFVYKIRGLEELHRAPIGNIPVELKSDLSSINERFESDFVRKQGDTSRFSFITLDTDNGAFHIEEGTWDVAVDIVIPPDHKLILKAGATINLLDSANILSYSPVFSLGTEERPVVITSTDSSGQGILVLKTEEKSVIENTVFHNLSAPDRNGWSLKGAVNFYLADVDFRHVKCSSNRKSDDCINVMNSEFSITKSQFQNTFADALDVDYGRGSVENTRFQNIKGDAIDCSGSKITGKNLQLDGIGDKGFSSGEASNMRLDQIDIRNSNIALASKDNSVVTVRNVNITSSNTAFAVFQKKSEYGPATLQADNSLLYDVKNEYLLERGSTLAINQIEKSDNITGARELLYSAL